MRIYNDIYIYSSCFNSNWQINKRSSGGHRQEEKIETNAPPLFDTHLYPHKIWPELVKFKLFFETGMQIGQMVRRTIGSPA